MSHTVELIDALQRHLSAAGYTKLDRGRIGRTDFEAVLTTPQASRRFACAVVRLPGSVRNVKDAAQFVGDVRRSLTKHYVPGFPWPKRLGTFTVLLGGRDLCERLRDREGLLVDTGGLHVNVLLGTVIVDVETLRTRSDNTWGLLETGQQFQHIQDAVASWCRTQRRSRRAESRGTAELTGAGGSHAASARSVA